MCKHTYIYMCVHAEICASLHGRDSGPYHPPPARSPSTNTNIVRPNSSAFVPIDLPCAYEKYLKSAARRALGPAGDSLERSGV